MPPGLRSGATLAPLLGAVALLAPVAASAVEMVNDPKGFQDIPWGAPLAARPDLTEVGSGDRIKEYERTDGSPRLGDVPVASLRYSSIDGQFARVTIRYQGGETHRKILSYLQGRFGPLDLTPGQLAGGAEQQFTWRGLDTEINLLYRRRGERGLLFIDSRVLAPRFIEAIGCQ